jgi:hypothetical protein
MVRARLTKDDDTIHPKPQWPSTKTCPLCFKNEARWRIDNATGTPTYLST